MSDRRSYSSGSPFEPKIGFTRALRTGNRVLVSGTGPIWPDGSFDPDPAAQARRCMEIVVEALGALGAGVADVVRTRQYLTDPGVGDAVSAVHAEFFGSEPPASTMVVVKALMDPRWVYELEAEAWV